MKLPCKIILSIVICALVICIILFAVIMGCLYHFFKDTGIPEGTWEYNDGDLKITVFVPRNCDEYNGTVSFYHEVCKAEIQYNGEVYKSAFAYDTWYTYKCEFYCVDEYDAQKYYDSSTPYVFDASYKVDSSKKEIKLKHFRVSQEFEDLLSEYENKDIVLTCTGEYK